MGERLTSSHLTLAALHPAQVPSLAIEHLTRSTLSSGRAEPVPATASLEALSSNVDAGLFLVRTAAMVDMAADAWAVSALVLRSCFKQRRHHGATMGGCVCNQTGRPPECFFSTPPMRRLGGGAAGGSTGGSTRCGAARAGGYLPVSLVSSCLFLVVSRTTGGTAGSYSLDMSTSNKAC